MSDTQRARPTELDLMRGLPPNQPPQPTPPRGVAALEREAPPEWRAKQMTDANMIVAVCAFMTSVVSLATSIDFGWCT